LKKVWPLQPQTTSFGPVTCRQNLGIFAQTPSMSKRPQVPGLN
jgi:hypothetical protein